MNDASMMSGGLGGAKHARPQPVFTITPADVQANRFLFYMITYLLCTPSDFAELVESGGDLDAWLRNAGVEHDKPFSRTRNVCAEFVNRIKRHPVVPFQMCGLRCSLSNMQIALANFYDRPPCPMSVDEIRLIRAALKIRTEETVPNSELSN
jgi:hypothetical protein